MFNNWKRWKTRHFQNKWRNAASNRLWQNIISGRYINTRKGDVVEVYDYNTMSKINIDNVIGLNETTENNKYIIAISSDEKYKIMDVANNMLKKDEYDYLEYIGKDEFIAYKNGKFGIVDVNAKKIVDFKYDDLQRIENEEILKGIIKSAENTNVEYVKYDGSIAEYSSSTSVYPEKIENLKKIDLGYGEPYYTKAQL